jgi:hypothetical protein
MGEKSESKNHSSGCFKNLKEPLGFMKEWVVVWMANFWRTMVLFQNWVFEFLTAVMNL